MNILDIIKKVLPQGFIKFIQSHVSSIIAYAKNRSEFLNSISKIISRVDLNNFQKEKLIIESFNNFEQRTIDVITKAVNKEKTHE